MENSNVFAVSEMIPEDILEVFNVEATQDKLYRGVQPDDIEQKCLDLCSNFIAGPWSNLTLQDVNVERISGGLVNQFYRITIRNSTTRPYDVGIKFYQEKMVKDKDTESRTNDVIVLKAISDLGIGPKVYGLSEKFAILDFIPVRNLSHFLDL